MSGKATIEMTNLRSPICCIMGHVDAGKTSLLDSIRSSSVATGEAGGITQQIGATFISTDFIKSKTTDINGKFSTNKLHIPGVLMIDTPGHEAFFKLRQRGSSMCDIAILAIDIMEGILPQTKEAIELLKLNKVPFVIAATKLDKVWEWESNENSILRKSFKKQTKGAQTAFEGHIETLKWALKEEDISSEFYLKNKDPKKYVSIVPVCSIQNEGVSDLLSLMGYLTTNMMEKKLKVKDKLKASIMEVFQDKRLGWMMDVILVNGTLNVGDSIIVPKLSGCEEIKIRNLLLPSNTIEMDKNKKWETQSSVVGSCGVRIIATGLEGVLAGGHLYKSTGAIDEMERAIGEVEKLLEDLPRADSGVILMAETLGALEAASFLFSKEEINVKNYNIGKLNDKLIEKLSIMMRDEEEANKVILYFGKVEDNVAKRVKEIGLTLISNEVVYQLLEKYNEFKTKTIENIHDILISRGEAVLPVKIKMLKEFLFVKGGSKHFLIGVKVLFGKLKKGTPLAVSKDGNVLHLGVVESIQKDGKERDEGVIGDKVCIKINNPNHLTLGRQFDEKWIMYSHQSRKSIDNLKKYFREILKREDWKMVIEQKQVLSIK